MQFVADRITTRQRREAVQATEEEIRPISWAWRNPAVNNQPVMPTWVPTDKSNRYARSYWRALARIYEGRRS